MMARKTPEEKAAKRRAAFERRVIQTASGDASTEARSKAKVDATEAALTGGVAAKARQLSAQGRPFNFRMLGVSVLNGTVYAKDAGGLRRLGPLVGAVAGVTRHSPRRRERSGAAQVIFMAPPTWKAERAMATVVCGGATHQKMVEQHWNGDGTVQRAQRDAQDFNRLVRLAEESGTDPKPGM
jgi:hypothetical protein